MIEVIFLICLALAIGAISAFLILTAKKLGIIEYYNIHRKRPFPEFCEFCAGFWISVILTVLYFWIPFGEHLKWIYVCVPPIAAAVSRRLTA